MSRPDQHTDTRGGRHTTHAPFALSDTDVSEDDYDLDDIYEGWGWASPEDEEDDYS